MGLLILFVIGIALISIAIFDTPGSMLASIIAPEALQ